MIKQELKVLFTAIMFYSRIPVPKIEYPDELLNKATRYFPFVGIIVGAIGALTFVISHLVLSTNISVLAAMISMIMATGAFHEDAISDFCDGFGGGYTKEKILDIMKDSRIGTYGAVAIVMLLLSKFFLLSEIDTAKMPIILISAHALSRLSTIVMIYSSNYVRFDNNSKAKPIGQKHSFSTIVIASIFGLTPLCFLPTIYIPFILVILLILFVYFRYYVHKIIGGYTGDVLGTLQQLSEIGFYLVYIVCSKML
ncbi:MAG: adenosylcobinamide-GDP ribazoletransferase [Bacteroidota bacterium]